MIELPDGLSLDSKFFGSVHIVKLTYNGAYAVVHFTDRWWRLGLSLWAPSQNEVEAGLGRLRSSKYTGKGWRDRLLADAITALHQAAS